MVGREDAAGFVLVAANGRLLAAWRGPKLVGRQIGNQIPGRRYRDDLSFQASRWHHEPRLSLDTLFRRPFYTTWPQSKVPTSLAADHNTGAQLCSHCSRRAATHDRSHG